MNRTYKSTTFLVLVLSFCLFAYACTVDHTNTTPEQSQKLAQLEAAQAAASTPEDKAKAEADLQAFESEVFSEKAGPVIGAINAISPELVPWSFLATALLPMLGKRGRSKAKDGLKSTWTAVSTASPQAAGQAVMDALGYLGVAHSSPDSKAVAEGTAVAVPTNEGAAVQV